MDRVGRSLPCDVFVEAFASWAFHHVIYIYIYISMGWFAFVWSLCSSDFLTNLFDWWPKTLQSRSYLVEVHFSNLNTQVCWYEQSDKITRSLKERCAPNRVLNGFLVQCENSRRCSAWSTTQLLLVIFVFWLRATIGQARSLECWRVVNRCVLWGGYSEVHLVQFSAKELVGAAS